jgi:hypothetical protein
MQHYTYLKSDEDKATDRALHGETKPDNLVRALDVSALSGDDRVKAIAVYDKWVAEHQKPFDDKVKAMKRLELKPLKDFFIENGFEVPPEVKSFKPGGLALQESV